MFVLQKIPGQLNDCQEFEVDRNKAPNHNDPQPIHISPSVCAERRIYGLALLTNMSVLNKALFLLFF